MNTYILLVNGVGEYAAFNFSNGDWSTTFDLSDESILLTVKARNFDSALKKFEKMVVGEARYRSKFSFTDENLHEFSIEELGQARKDMEEAKKENEL